MKIDRLKCTEVYDAYWRFAKKRQDIFFARIDGLEFPWSDDEILNTHKFTNAYRASDRVSQYLIKNVIYTDEKYSSEDMIFRILLFKLFNKIETWQYLESSLGSIDYVNYNFEKYANLLVEYSQNHTLYSGAYIMPSGKSSFGFQQKCKNNLKLLEYLFQNGISSTIANAKHLSDIYDFLLAAPSLGSFLAFQFAIDLNYSELCDFDEMTFVVAGPGAISGIHKCFVDTAGYSYEDIIKIMADSQECEFDRLELDFKTLYGRRLQLIDCQNIFCETNKYARIAFPNVQSHDQRTRIKQHFSFDKNKDKIDYFYPPKWNLRR